MKFVIKWMYYRETTQLFIGAGFVIGNRLVGLTISNLFVGFER